VGEGPSPAGNGSSQDEQPADLLSRDIRGSMRGGVVAEVVRDCCGDGSKTRPRIPNQRWAIAGSLADLKAS